VLPTFSRSILLHLEPSRLRQYVPPKRWYLPTRPHGVTTQETNIGTVFENRVLGGIFGPEARSNGGGGACTNVSSMICNLVLYHTWCVILGKKLIVVIFLYVSDM
jgi:hypothetical protein